MSTAREVLDELADKRGWTYEEMLVVACSYIDAMRSPIAFQEFVAGLDREGESRADEEDTLVDLSPPKVQP